MAGKNVIDNWGKEDMRRHLMSTILCSANTGRLKGSHSRWATFWQRLIKKTRVL